MLPESYRERSMYLAKTPHYVQHLFPDCTWQIKTKRKSLYLTFDDGPVPESTPFLLETLRRYNAKATFFCVGQNIEKHRDLYASIVSEGHSIGSHTRNHVSGWTSSNLDYYKNVRSAASQINTKLFRPPYGRIRPSQIRFLSKYYKIIMWDVLSADFDQNISPEKCLQNVLTNADKGSIVVFHDSKKSIEKLKWVLPKVLDHFSEKSYTFKAL